MKPMSLLRAYFGMNGQTLTQFQTECKALEAQCGSRDAYLDFCEEVAKAHGCTLDRS